VIPLTQEDLAGVAGTSRATVNRVLGEAAAEGVLEVGRGKINILEPDKLAKRAR
jgi:CRP-like cAMP-binding protein